MATAKLNASMADYKYASKSRKRLSLINAPFTGIIGRIPNKKGSMIQDGDLCSPVFRTIATCMSTSMSPNRNTSITSSMQPNATSLPLTLILANGTDSVPKGHFQNVEGEFDNSTGNIAFRAKFPNPDHLLRNGETGTVRMNIPVRMHWSFRSRPLMKCRTRNMCL
jgi:membrane fusion protein (multidrug efflux system)